VKVVLFEFIDEARLVLKRYGRDFLSSADTTIICLHPKVRAFLKKQGIEARDTLPYFDNASQHRIVFKVEELTQLILRQVVFKDSLGIEKGYQEDCIYHLRFYLNHFLWIMEILHSAMQKYDVEEVLCCIPKDAEGMYIKNVYIQEQERFLGLLAKDFCVAESLRFKPVYLEKRKNRFFMKLLATFAHQGVRVMAIIDYLFFKADISAADKVIVVPALSYNMTGVVKEIKKHYPNVKCVIIWEGGDTLRQELSRLRFLLVNNIQRIKKTSILNAVVCLDLVKDKFKPGYLQQEKFGRRVAQVISSLRLGPREEFNLYGVSFLPYLIGKLEYGLKMEIASLEHSTIFLGDILKRIKPKLLMSMYSVGIYYMMGELSSVVGFPSLNISHGTHVPPNNEFEKVENYRLSTSVITNTYTYVAVQTPWAEKFLDYYKDRRPRVYSGPLIYSRKDEGCAKKSKSGIPQIPSGHKIIVHASTQKTRRGMRFHIEETLDEYVASLADLVSAVDDLEGIFLIIRPHPVCEISEAEFKELLPVSNKFLVMNKGPFKNVLSLADLLVSYSSTCIEEALQSRIPVVLYDKWRRYNHFNTEETNSVETIARKPVYYICDPQVLKKCLPVLIDNFDRKVLDNEELKEYKYPDDYRSNFSEFIDRIFAEEVAV